MQSTYLWVWVAFGLAVAAAVAYGNYRSVPALFWKVLVCLVPIFASALIVGHAVNQYNTGEGGFKLGVDLVGGTRLIYEIDPNRPLPENFKIEQLVSSLKKRIDPADLYNITIRPAGERRVEIVLPTGGAHQARLAEEAWRQVLDQVNEKYKAELDGEKVAVGRGQANDLKNVTTRKILERQWQKLLTALNEKYPKLKDAKDLKLDDIPPGRVQELISKIKDPAGANEAELTKFASDTFKPVPFEDVSAYVDQIYGAKGRRKDFTAAEVERIMDKIRQVGSLEFRILANQNDDKPVMEALTKYYADAAKGETEADKVAREAILAAARDGKAPPVPNPPEGEAWDTSAPAERELGKVRYAWVEIGRSERAALGLDNAQGTTGGIRWRQLADARTKGRKEVKTPDGKPVFGPDGKPLTTEVSEVVPYDNNRGLFMSRECTNQNMKPEDRATKKYEYFLLTRVPQPDERVTGQNLIDVTARPDPTTFDRAVSFSLNTEGGNRFYTLTYRNRPDGPGGFKRALAIVLDDMIVSAPNLNEPIRSSGQISGRFTEEQVNTLVSILRSGALPATLKPEPEDKDTTDATLGAETIRKGTMAVGLAFLAVLVFMCAYYRFAGVVASIALLANLLLTVAFMVFVNATFTLPGLAGLVLTLGMAVDANVLIYERLREERDRGASILVALRNGYDRALPTIIDTHLTSIFTAIVLYVVGNEQLKGFGVSLAAGLIISLFTSLFMTRTLFDLWTKLGLLSKLGMARFLTKPRINFMAIRYYWFAATAILTIIGISVFLWRGPSGLSIDFVGGTSYTALLKEGEQRDYSEFHQFFTHDAMASRLNVQSVTEKNPEGTEFEIAYADGTRTQVSFKNPDPGATPEERQTDVKARASTLPDLAIFPEKLANGKTTLFTITTTEKERDLVQISIDRLLQKDGQSLQRKVEIVNNFDQEIKAEAPAPAAADARRDTVIRLKFNAPASPSAVKVLLEREIERAGVKRGSFNVQGVGEPVSDMYSEMDLNIGSDMAAELHGAKLREVLKETKTAFAVRPQPPKLRNIGGQLAKDAQTKAAYAVIASWIAILLYLWFRFGTWKFGAAAVICLMHDLFFTLGIIAFCHYVVSLSPGLAGFLLLEDFKLDLPAIAALLTLVGYSVSDTIVVFDRIKEVRGKNPMLTPQMINDSINQTLSRTILAATTVFLVVLVLFLFGGEGVHLFAFVMVVGVVVGTYSSIYIASPLLLIFGEGVPAGPTATPAPTPAPQGVEA